MAPTTVTIVRDGGSTWRLQVRGRSKRGAIELGAAQTDVYEFSVRTGEALSPFLCVSCAHGPSVQRTVKRRGRDGGATTVWVQPTRKVALWRLPPDQLEIARKAVGL